MTAVTYVEKAEIVAALRSRGLNGRADWVDGALPALVDTTKNAALLQTLGIDAEAMAHEAAPDLSNAPEHSR